MRLHLFMLFALLAAVSQATAETLAHEKRAVRQAIVRHNTPSPEPLRITVERIHGKFARGKVASEDGTGEIETVYLEKKNGKWMVLDQGTGATPYDSGIPLDKW